MSGLSREEKEQFIDKGYLIKEEVFKETDFEAVKTSIDQLIDGMASGLKEKGLIEKTFSEESFEQRLNKIYEHYPEQIKEFFAALQGAGGGAFADQSMLDTLRHEGLLSCIEDLVGPDIIGSSVFRIRPKVSGFTGGEVCWHQDSGYLLPHCDDELIVTCWIPLLDVDDNMGCLYVIPESHKGPVLDHCTGGNAHFLVIPDDQLPDTKPVCCEMKVGSVLFMTNKTPHASFENNSGKVRWSLDLRYQSFETPNNIVGFSDKMPESKTEINIPCYTPEADFIIRDSKNPKNEITDEVEFRKLREKYQNVYKTVKGRNWKPYLDYKK